MTVPQIKQLEEKLMTAFREEAMYLLPSVPSSDLDWLSLAQHHGLPTRLMDWSSNPLLALFFALGARNPPNPTVWIYDATTKQIRDGEEHKKSPQDLLTAFLRPSRHSNRVTAQSGWHTVHHFHLEKEKKRIETVCPLDGMKYHKGRITLIEIACDAAKKIRTELKDMGIHHTTVYGDLASACTGIKEDLEVPSDLM